MDKRYQVFVSSTYQDLKDERIEVIQALLELDCIPVGMEYFPAADESQWEFIKKLIDESDYYVVIVGGKYGSMDNSGKSYTQKEYEYALEKGIPIISFVHADTESLPSSKTEKDGEKLEKLRLFKELVQKKLCKFWRTPHDLGAVVSRSISQAKKNYPRVGWIRADMVEETSNKEILNLYKRIQQLEKELSESNKTNLTLTEKIELADGNEIIDIRFDLNYGDWNNKQTLRQNISLSLNEISYYLLPKIVNPIAETTFKSSFKAVIRENWLDSYANGHKNLSNLTVAQNSSAYDTINIQYQLLEWIELYDIEREKDGQLKTVRMVRLTDAGRNKLIQLRAISK